jgi:hypothetical protein
LIRVARIHDDALPFILGYLLRDIPEGMLCETLAAWQRHLRDLEGLEAQGLALVQAEEPLPRD